MTYSRGDNLNSFADDDVLHDQLPSIEEARTQAIRSLRIAEHLATTRRTKIYGSSSRLHRSGRFSSSNIRRELGRAKQRRCAWIVLTLGILFVAIGILVLGIVFLKARSSNNNNDSPATAQEIRNFLIQNSLASETTLNNPDSAQAKAILWMESKASPPPVPNTAGDDNNNSDNFEFTQRYALAVFYYALGGDRWAHKFDFLLTLDPCQWNSEFEGTNGRTFLLGASCNSERQVSALHLPGNKLRGEIPSEIRLMSQLRYVALDHNGLNGILPRALEQLTDLDYLALQRNLIRGPLPSWLGSLTKLRYLGLGGNGLHGRIPETFLKLTNMITLGIDNNGISGDLTFLEKMTQLERLYLEKNRFRQPLSWQAFKNFQKLEELDLSSNRFTGTIPRELMQHSTLRSLDLSSNDITGTIPYLTMEQTNLKYLVLKHNHLRQQMPSSLSLFRRLAHLDLSENELTGTIPPSLGNLPLKYLALGSNPLQEAPIPQFMSSLSSLEHISLEKCRRNGTIPTFFGNLQNLTHFQVNGNSITGRVPSNFARLSVLDYLLINQNEGIVGPLLPEIQRLPRLDVLVVTGTSIEGDLSATCSRSQLPRIVGADCDELICSCCTVCCTDDQTCRDSVFFGEMDGSWKYSFPREFYEFAPSIIFGGSS